MSNPTAQPTKIKAKTPALPRQEVRDICSSIDDRDAGANCAAALHQAASQRQAGAGPRRRFQVEAGGARLGRRSLCNDRLATASVPLLRRPALAFECCSVRLSFLFMCVTLVPHTRAAVQHPFTRCHALPLRPR